MIRIFLIFMAVFILVHIGLQKFNPRERFYKDKFKTPIHRLDYLDDDILRMYNTNLTQCVNMCANDNECKGFVYVPRDSLCKFKATFDNPVFSRGHISFLKKD
jgi:hypothetical protein